MSDSLYDLQLHLTRLAGFLVGKLGKSHKANPYWRYSPLWLEWSRGWREGRRERA